MDCRVFAGGRVWVVTALSAHLTLAPNPLRASKTPSTPASSEPGYLVSPPAFLFFHVLLNRGERTTHPHLGRNSEIRVCVWWGGGVQNQAQQLRSAARLPVPRREGGLRKELLKQRLSHPPPGNTTLLQAQGWKPKPSRSDKKAAYFPVSPGNRISRQPEC